MVWCFVIGTQSTFWCMCFFRRQIVSQKQMKRPQLIVQKI